MNVLGNQTVPERYNDQKSIKIVIISLETIKNAQGYA